MNNTIYYSGPGTYIRLFVVSYQNWSTRPASYYCIIPGQDFVNNINRQLDPFPSRETVEEGFLAWEKSQ